MATDERISAEELARLRQARRAHALAAALADQATVALKLACLEVATAHDCEPENLTMDGRIKRA